MVCVHGGRKRKSGREELKKQWSVLEVKGAVIVYVWCKGERT